MKNMPIYEALAQAFAAAEGVDTDFTLMGDGNMHWAAAMKNLDGMGSYFARHEHSACAAAMGYHLATGKVGVASVTCDPMQGCIELAGRQRYTGRARPRGIGA